jgi:hypothetical protein
MPRKKKRKKNREETTSPPELIGIARLLVESPVEKLDLHGMNADQAETRVRFFFQRHATTSPGRVVHVITGKGTRSEAAPKSWPLTRRLSCPRRGTPPGGYGPRARTVASRVSTEEPP